MKKSKFHADDSRRMFENLPRNRNDYNGSIVLFSVNSNTFFRISFGSGDNLDAEDIENGFDDYLDIQQFKWNGTRPLLNIIDELKYDDVCLDEIDGLEDVDGGLMLLKHKEWKDGDIRRYLIDALDFGGYGVADGEIYGNDLIFISFHD